LIFAGSCEFLLLLSHPRFFGRILLLDLTALLYVERGLHYGDSCK
jgi:hypothetical protein